MMTRVELIQLEKLAEKLVTSVNERGQNDVVTEAGDVFRFYVCLEIRRLELLEASK